MVTHTIRLDRRNPDKLEIRREAAEPPDRPSNAGSFPRKRESPFAVCGLVSKTEIPAFAGMTPWWWMARTQLWPPETARTVEGNTLTFMQP